MWCLQGRRERLSLFMSSPLTPRKIPLPLKIKFQPFFHINELLSKFIRINKSLRESRSTENRKVSVWQNQALQLLWFILSLCLRDNSGNFPVWGWVSQAVSWERTPWSFWLTLATYLLVHVSLLLERNPILQRTTLFFPHTCLGSLGCFILHRFLLTEELKAGSKSKEPQCASVNLQILAAVSWSGPRTKPAWISKWWQLFGLKWSCVWCPGVSG